MIAALAATALAGAPFVLDLTAAPALLEWRPVAMNAPALCGDGQGTPVPDADVRLLGVAMVVYSRKSGNSMWGHASLRFLGCRGGVVVDDEYEYYKLSEKNLDPLALEHAGEAFLDDHAYLESQLGKLALFRNPDPADGGEYAEAIRNNREIHELWLDVDDATLLGIYHHVHDAYDAQLSAFRAREDLPTDYHGTSTNCTTSMQRLLPPNRWPYRIFPFAYLRRLLREGKVELAVTYPSRHVLIGMARRDGWLDALAADGWHPEVRRRHPLLRRPGPLPDDAMAALALAHGPTAAPAVRQLRRARVATSVENGYTAADDGPVEEP